MPHIQFRKQIILKDNKNSQYLKPGKKLIMKTRVNNFHKGKEGGK